MGIEINRYFINNFKTLSGTRESLYIKYHCTNIFGKQNKQGSIDQIPRTIRKITNVSGAN